MDATATRKDDSSFDVCREKLNKLRVEKMKSSGGAQWRCRLICCAMLVVVLCFSFPSFIHKPTDSADFDPPPSMKSVASGSDESIRSTVLSQNEGAREKTPRKRPEEERRETGAKTQRKKATNIEGVETEDIIGREKGQQAAERKSKGATEEASISFEVFGKVQGVSFRAYTKRVAEKLGLKGWVQNTKQGTVVGQAEGPARRLAKLKEWLEFTGSPKSEVSRLVAEQRRIPDDRGERFARFEIRK